MQFVESKIATLKTRWAKHVAILFKDASAVQSNINPDAADLIHATLGVAGESGELVDAVKRWVIYGKPLDRENVVEELGDLRFYMQAIQNRLEISDEEIESHNISKLESRYPEGYSDHHAAARLDKE